MNIVEAATVLNVRPDADHLVVKAAYHALAKRYHPDQGGDTATMQRVNAAYDYMSTRTKTARQAEWERLQPKPMPQQKECTSDIVERVKAELRQKEEAARKAAASHNPAPPAGSTTRPWKPTPSRRERWTAWRRHQAWPMRWLLNLSQFLAILAGRLAVVAGMLYVFAESVQWAIASLAHGAWVLLIFFPGIPVALAGLYVTAILAGNFLHGGWKGLGDFFMDRGHEGLQPDPNAWTRKKASRTRWI